jgi:hypothetical protein
MKLIQKAVQLSLDLLYAPLENKVILLKDLTYKVRSVTKAISSDKRVWGVDSNWV